MGTEYPRPCERRCVQCGEWKHHSRYRTWTRRFSTKSTITFSDRCRDCEQKERNDKKNADRPKAIVEQRARSAASKASISFDFFWMQMNYRALVPELRAMMTEQGLCKGCGHKFLNERDIQIEHIEPPRFQQDWARLHARNLRLACGSCNRTKSNKPFAEWLDEQESARLSNLMPHQKEPQHEIEIWHQSDLFKL